MRDLFLPMVGAGYVGNQMCQLVQHTVIPLARAVRANRKAARRG